MPVFPLVIDSDSACLSFTVVHNSDQYQPRLTPVVDYLTFTFLSTCTVLLWVPFAVFVVCFKDIGGGETGNEGGCSADSLARNRVSGNWIQPTVHPIRSWTHEYKTGNTKYHTTIISLLSSVSLSSPPEPRPLSHPRDTFAIMKGCLVVNAASPRNSPRPPARKCVSFCGSGSNSSSSSDDEQEIVEVHLADDWDRTPCEITPKLTYQ